MAAEQQVGLKGDHNKLLLIAIVYIIFPCGMLYVLVFVRRDACRHSNGRAWTLKLGIPILSCRWSGHLRFRIEQ